jgi:uncharacterized protein
MKKINFSDFKFQAQDFLKSLFLVLEQNKIVIEKYWNIDHLCYRTKSDDEYFELKNRFSEFSNLLVESEVNGRLISTFRLREPLQYDCWTIDLVELPAPKKGRITPSGFEHIEVVVDVSFESLKKRFANCPFEETGLKKDFNQELEINFGPMAIKFHHLSLSSVVNVEKNTELFSGLRELKIFSDFKKFFPLISGTYPLNIQIENSDVDILMQTEDLVGLQNLLQSKYGDLQHYNSAIFKNPNGKALVVTFEFSGFIFEIYAEDKPTVVQSSNLHFILQERILKLANNDFFNKIRDLKKSGIKTEPAFAQVLKMTGDPYLVLLGLQKKSEAELKKMIATSIF